MGCEPTEGGCDAGDPLSAGRNSVKLSSEPLSLMSFARSAISYSVTPSIEVSTSSGRMPARAAGDPASTDVTSRRPNESAAPPPPLPRASSPASTGSCAAANPATSPRLLSPSRFVTTIVSGLRPDATRSSSE